VTGLTRVCNSGSSKDVLVKAIRVENFVSVSVSGTSAKVETRTIDGSVLDAFELKGPAVR